MSKIVASVPSKSKIESSTPSFAKIHSFDVLFGRGKGCSSHPGNGRMRAIAKQACFALEGIEDRKTKTRIIDEAVARILHTSPGEPPVRFFKQTPASSNNSEDSWEQVVSSNEIRRKILQCIVGMRGKQAYGTIGTSSNAQDEERVNIASQSEEGKVQSMKNVLTRIHPIRRRISNDNHLLHFSKIVAAEAATNDETAEDATKNQSADVPKNEGDSIPLPTESSTSTQESNKRNSFSPNQCINILQEHVQSQSRIINELSNQNRLLQWNMNTLQFRLENLEARVSMLQGSRNHKFVDC